MPPSMRYKILESDRENVLPSDVDILEHELLAIVWLRRYFPLIRIYLCLLFVITACICLYTIFKMLFYYMFFNDKVCPTEPIFLLAVIPMVLVFLSNMVDSQDIVGKGPSVGILLGLPPLGSTVISFCTNGSTALSGLLLTLCYFVTVSGIAMWIARPLPPHCRRVGCIVVPIIMLVFYFGQLSRITRNILSAINHLTMGLIIWDTTLNSISKPRVNIVAASMVYCDILITLYYMYVYLLTPTLWTLNPHKMFRGIPQLLAATFNSTFCPDSFVCECLTIGC
ncbi:membrane protein US12B [Cercopithecine betaherpesvirus 5]|uniref:Membrane protein US12B n=1 Tax=Simian cytomegalovirus (strain Colburn) TaxID=50292 RepID=G8XTL9_SCMVC|nr:membrane protein US12B [Cercopithecine betaherpesvirus 5]AEV80511.1 membrane protein US12B [Cercopithecine betaherpesvirus 5]